MKKIFNLTIMVVMLSNVCKAQNDTAAIIKDFNKVVAFFEKPFVYYTCTSYLTAQPVLVASDTMRSNSVFYKSAQSYYLQQLQQEYYIQDSFMIEINNDKKTIWVSKIDEGSKQKLSILPLSNKDLQAVIRNNYAIAQQKLDAQHQKITFDMKDEYAAYTSTKMNISLTYDSRTYLPNAFELNVQFKKSIDDEGIQQLRDDGLDTQQLVQQIGDNKFLLRTQQMKVIFNTIAFEKNTVAAIPDWTTVLTFQQNENSFIAKGKYSSYEITQTF
ncbi:hypothetical protein ACFOWM_04260 [Ferruginibacter yonginensis]|uniref:Uncharacterized protein n=1 Tax=Ferruginibacter yonginensis TaxID=1310416 RepID=A0ABV8QT43_9BACT